MAVGENWKIAYSPDGITWMPVAESPFWNANCVIYGNGKFVAGGTDGESASLVAYSTDGMIWTSVSDLPFPFSFGEISAVAYDGTGNYLAVSYNGMGVESIAAYSPDAVTWTIRMRTYYSVKAAIAYGAGKFVYGTDRTLVWLDGANADVVKGFSLKNEPNSIFGSSSITAIAYGREMFVAGGEDGKMAYSTDGLTWTALANSGFGATQVNSIAFGNGTFVVVGNDGKIAYSR